MPTTGIPRKPSESQRGNSLCHQMSLCKCLRSVHSSIEEDDNDDDEGRLLLDQRTRPIEHVYCDLSGISHVNETTEQRTHSIILDQYVISENETSQSKGSLILPPIPSHKRSSPGCSNLANDIQGNSSLSNSRDTNTLLLIGKDNNNSKNYTTGSLEKQVHSQRFDNNDLSQERINFSNHPEENRANYSDGKVENKSQIIINNYLDLIENYDNSWKDLKPAKRFTNTMKMSINKDQTRSSDLKLDQVLEELNDLNRTVKKYQTLNNTFGLTEMTTSQTRGKMSRSRSNQSQSHGDLRYSPMDSAENDVHFGTNSNLREHYRYQEFVERPYNHANNDRILDLSLGGSCNSIIKFDKPMPIFSPKIVQQTLIREGHEPKINLRRSPSPPLIEPRPPVRIPYPEMPRPPSPPNIDTRPVGAVHWCRGEKGGCAGVESCQLRTTKEVHLPPPLPIPESQEAHKKLLRENQVPSQIDKTLPTEAWLPEDEEARRRYKLAQQQRNAYTQRMRDYQLRLEEYQNKLIERRRILQANDEAEMKYQIERQKYLERLNKKRSQSTGRIITHGNQTKSPNIYRTTLFTSQSLRCSAKQLDNISADNSPNICRKATYINPSGLNHPLAKSEGNRLYVKPPKIYPEEYFDKECIGLEPIGPGVHHLESSSSHHSPRVREETIIDESNMMPLQHQAEPIKTVEGAFERGLKPTPVDFDQLLNAVRHTSPQWYKPMISRDDVIERLANLPAGSFVVRESSTFQNSYGLALKVTRLPHHVKIDPNCNMKNQLVRHFLIDRISGGFRIRGYENELIFSTLSELVAYHCRKIGALPCTLKLPGYAPAPTQADLSQTGLEKEILRDTTILKKHRSRSNTPHRSSSRKRNNILDRIVTDRCQQNTNLAIAETQNDLIENFNVPNINGSSEETNSAFRQLLPNGAACIMYYLSSSDISQLSGAIGLRTGIDKMMSPTRRFSVRSIEVNFNVIADGIVMTDIHRRCFFRRHYPLKNLLYFNIDPDKREFTMQINKKSYKLKILGFITRVSDNSSENRCHILSECERGESAKVINQFINKYLMSQNT